MSRFIRSACTSALACMTLLGAAPAFAAPATTITLGTTATNVVATWHDIAAATLGGTGTASITPEELRPLVQTDMTTVALAMYNASAAIDGRYQPYAVTARSPVSGASVDAAIGAAAYGVLRGLFPSRSAHYQDAYDKFVAGLPAGAARDKGLVLGAEAAAAMLANRARDGRSVELAPYVPSAEAGKFRGAKAVLMFAPSIRPYALTRIDQFRPGPPPALSSATYAADLNETKSLGGGTSATRTEAQSRIALFHTEGPLTSITRNFGRFARSTSDPADAARLLAAIYMVHADAILACFDAKYHYNAWRPHSAIAFADTDDNPATEADKAWASSQFTPYHPEYPAAHSCTSGALATLLRHYYGSGQVAFTFDSSVTGTTHHYATVEALQQESSDARIFGGMHFRFSTKAGDKLGTEVAEWTMRHHFGPRK
jgi:hypothetical protein